MVDVMAHESVKYVNVVATKANVTFMNISVLAHTLVEKLWQTE